jgi:hypothetical protein
MIDVCHDISSDFQEGQSCEADAGGGGHVSTAVAAYTLDCRVT